MLGCASAFSKRFGTADCGCGVGGGERSSALVFEGFFFFFSNFFSKGQREQPLSVTRWNRQKSKQILLRSDLGSNAAGWIFTGHKQRFPPAKLLKLIIFFLQFFTFLDSKLWIIFNLKFHFNFHTPNPLSQSVSHNSLRYSGGKSYTSCCSSEELCGSPTEAAADEQSSPQEGPDRFKLS